jgi:hypothetical protein
MKRLLSACIAGVGIASLCVAVGLTHAAPARPLYQPAAAPAPPPPRVQVNLAGTAWLGKYQTVNRIFIFEPDGTLSYRTTAKSGKIYKNRGTWKVDDDKIHFEHYTTPANKLMEFHGTVVNPSTITGEATYRLNNTAAKQTMERTTLDAK